ncbi:Protein Y8A9A.2 [Aphelenchoides avenae]|nr:Protein Y8A9A.2 [Aphelenchus avenae]
MIVSPSGFRYAVWSPNGDDHDCYAIAYHWHWTHGTYHTRHWTYSAKNRHTRYRCYNIVDGHHDGRYWDHRVNADPADYRNGNNGGQHDDHRDWYDRKRDNDGVDWNRRHGHGDHNDSWNRDHNDAGYRDHNDAWYRAHDHTVHDVDYTEHNEHTVAKRHDRHAYADDDETELLWNLERLGGDVALQGLVWSMLDGHDDEELHYSACMSLQGNTTTTASACPSCCLPGGVWSSWRVSNCTDTCGGYGTQTQSRTCLSATDGCPCSGPATMSARCNFKPCSYPRDSCATGYSLASANGVIECVSMAPTTMPPVTTTPPNTCCPTGGIWDQWGAWTSCSTACGSCSTMTRSRACATASRGCPCANSAQLSTQTVPCNRQPCDYPQQSCCSPYTAKSVGGQVICA